MSRSKRPPSLDPLNGLTPRVSVLANGTYSVVFTGAGSGLSACRGSALTSWDADRTEDGLGIFVYLRDLDNGFLWSAGHQPTRVPADAYEASFRPGNVALVRFDHEIETRLDVCVDPARDAEIRRFVLTNHSSRARTIELTSYAEIVLSSLAAHWAHPAFSKLFIQTEFEPNAQVLLASRRPRSDGERRLCLGAAMAGGEPLEFETDRARFIGRGQSLAKPVALASSGRLSSSAGNVLDPVFVLRRVARLAAGASTHFTLILAGAEDREIAITWVRSLLGEIDTVFERASERERLLRSRLGLSDGEAEALQQLAGAILYRDPRLRTDGAPPARIETIDAYWQALGLDIAHDAPRAIVEREMAPASKPTRRYQPAREEPASPGSAKSQENLLYENGYGGFAGGSEYVIRIPSSDGSRRPPMPWVNVVANERFGFLVSESGAGYTWSENSRENKLTAWSNDPVIDPHSEALYIRDEDERVFWSPLPGPTRDGGTFEVRHGFGYSRWRHTSQGLDQDVVAFVPRRDPIKVTIVRLRNTGERPRRLSIFGYQHLVLGVMPSETAGSVVTEVDRSSRAVLARNPRHDDFGNRVVFASVVTPTGSEIVRWSADRTAFLGRNGSVSNPAAVATAPALDGRTGEGLDPCAALQVEVELPAAGTIECAFLLGEAADADEARALIERYRRPGALRESLDEVQAFWRELVSAIQVETPSAAVDLMLNGWLVYQCLGCRVWGRSGFYQSGGAFGFRDQLQDSAALVYGRPDLTRAQLLLHAAHQFVEGDVLHWWHPPSDRGTRTRCSDDRLWLPYVTTFYIRATGDWGILEAETGFLTARPLENGEDETYLRPSRCGEQADLYEHCCRAIDRSLDGGPHGLPLIGTGDWNDGMNRVGREGRGESVWLGFFLYTVLEEFIPACERRGDSERALRYHARAEALRRALEDAGWDGGWYRRAYYDDGTPLGSADNDECRIDALAQAWAVISRAARPERARQAMEAAERELVSETDGLIRLLTPPFDRTPKDPGYIKGYVPGIRENGGQYTHGAVWVVRALAGLGRRDRAARLLEMLTPVHHSIDRAAAEAYKVEPYVVSADVYGADPHVGRGGWTWYTGSAAWLYRVALESVLGFTLEGGEALRLTPCVPDAWPRFTVRYRLPDGKTRYQIVVENPERSAHAVTSVTVDGEPGAVIEGAAEIPIVRDGRVHEVRLTLGSALPSSSKK